ncbi:MAG: MauE/DoxX family redox-associated membrane protein [Chryseolinea sp.]
MLKKILTYVFGGVMVLAGLNHFMNPQIYDPFIPDFLPKLAVNYVTGVLEFALGVGAIIPSTRHLATLGILLLMVSFLPLHTIDVFKDAPAIGSHQAALIRLPLQFVLILWAWWIWKG